MYNAEQTRQQILECAIHLFAQKGLDATSVQDIVAAAGCSKGGFFYHFATKNALIEAAFQKCQSDIEEAAMQGVDELESIVDKLCRRCYNLTKHAIEHPDVAAVNSMVLASPDYCAVHGFGYRALGRHFDSINVLVEQGIASGELKDMPSLLLGEMFSSIASVPYTYMQNEPDAFYRTEYWDNIYEVIRCALAKRP